jgi:hypothetical protein
MIKKLMGSMLLERTWNIGCLPPYTISRYTTVRMNNPRINNR